MRTEAKMIEMAKISLMRLHLIISPKHKRTEGRAPVWDSEYKSRYTTGGDSEVFAARLNVNFWDLCGDWWYGSPLSSGTAECNLEKPSGKKCALAAKTFVCDLGSLPKSVGTRNSHHHAWLHKFSIFF
jgi:hypothetical protein